MARSTASPKLPWLFRSVTYGLSAALLLITGAAATTASANPADQVNPLKKRFLTGTPLEVCDQGSFFVGGVPKVPDFGTPRQVIIGQMYTEFEIPSIRRKWPIIFVHGGAGLTGVDVEASPHGTEGWLPHAVRRNYATFVVDLPGRGRSGFDSTVINKARATGNLVLLPANGVGEATSEGLWTSFLGQVIPAGSNILNGTMIRHGDPGDPDPAETNPPSEGHGNYPPTFPIPPVDNSIDRNIEARVGAIGTAPNPINNKYLALNGYKYTVPQMDSLLPSSVCNTCVPTSVSPLNTWSGRALAELIERLEGAIVVAHSQGGDNMNHAIRILKERGELNLLKGILYPESGAGVSLAAFAAAGITPADFDNVSFFMWRADYATIAQRQSNRAVVDAINASPTRTVEPATLVELDSPEFGGRFNGTGHLSMMSTNNLDAFDFMC